MKIKTVYYVCKGLKKIGKPFATLEDAAGFLNFLLMFKPFNDYHIKECKKIVKE